MSRSVIYITSRAHSGSTLLSLLLSGHPRMIGLGEILSLLDFEDGQIFQQDQIQCSCGALMKECQFWGPVTTKLLRSQNHSMRENYDFILNEFYDHFGDQYIPIDASKTKDGLKIIAESDLDLSVLFLLRDVRPWVISMRKDRIRKGDFSIKDLVKRYGVKSPWESMKRTTYKYFWHWYLLNRKTGSYLVRNNIPTLQLGYEEMCLYPEIITRNICQFLGLEYDSRTLSLAESESHVLLGNRMRNQDEKRSRIFYDNRWFYQREWQLPAVLFPNIMKYNAREVYKNTRSGIWNQ